MSAQPDLAPAAVSHVVAMLYEVEAEIAEAEKRRDELKAQLIERGKGTYADARERTVTVVIPENGTAAVLSFTLYPQDAYKALLEEMGLKAGTPQVEKQFRAAREAQARALAGNDFLDLFDCIRTYEPRTGFADRVDALLTPAKARDLVGMCKQVKPAGKPGKAYVKLNTKVA